MPYVSIAPRPHKMHESLALSAIAMISPLPIATLFTPPSRAFRILFERSKTFLDAMGYQIIFSTGLESGQLLIDADIARQEVVMRDIGDTAAPAAAALAPKRPRRFTPMPIFNNATRLPSPIMKWRLTASAPSRRPSPRGATTHIARPTMIGADDYREKYRDTC